MENQTETQIQQVEKELLVLKSDEQPLKMSGSHADREERAQTLVNLFVKFIDEHIDLLVQVRQDFFDKSSAEKIMGCATFGEYCENVLHYSKVHIRRLIKGRNPATAIHDGSKNRLPATNPSNEDISVVKWLKRPGGFVSRCQDDPILRALVLEQGRLLDEFNDTSNFAHLLDAAELEGKIVQHIVDAAKAKNESDAFYTGSGLQD